MGRRGKLQTALEYAAARGVVDGIGYLPRSIAVAMGRGIGRVAYTFGGGLRRTGERNLELAFPDLSEVQRREILRGSFDSVGRLLGEFSQFPRHTPETLSRIVEYDEESMEYLRAAKAEGRGIIFLTLHLGAWELLSFAHSAIHHPLHFMVRRIDNPKVETLVERRRTRFGNVPVDKSASIRTAIRVLREGGTLGILADLNSQQKEGVFVPFFGHLACSTAGVAMLALRTDAVILPVCAPWDKERRRYLFQGQPHMRVIRRGDYEQEVLANTAQFTLAIERFVRRFPDQWMWIHKRWRTRPHGQPDLYAAPLPDATHNTHVADAAIITTQSDSKA